MFFQTRADYIIRPCLRPIYFTITYFLKIAFPNLTAVISFFMLKNHILNRFHADFIGIMHYTSCFAANTENYYISLHFQNKLLCWFKHSNILRFLCIFLFYIHKTIVPSSGGENKKAPPKESSA